MAVDTSSSLSSTSHTLTAAPAMAPAHAAPVSDVLALLESLRPTNRHAFLQPSAAIPTESLSLVKDTLEGFAAQVGEQQERKLKESRKRKRRGDASHVDVLQLRRVYVDGFETQQVWQQAKKIIQSVLKFSEETLDELEARKQVAVDGVGQDGGTEALVIGEGGFEVGLDQGEKKEDDELDSQDEEAEEDVSDDQDDNNEDEDEDKNDVDVEDDCTNEDNEETEAQKHVQDTHGLNDGFFSLDDFNRQTLMFEERDARGDPVTDQASDEEEIDWGTDPLAPTKGDSKPAKSKPADGELLSDDEEDDDGPTFGDMALDAPQGESEDEAMQEGADDGAEFNANEIYYKDFFAQPSKKIKGGKPRKSVTFEPQAPAEGDMERAMADVRRDLFEDDSEHEDSDDGLSDVSAGDPKSRRSAHERRQAKLAEEIRRLEAASVTKREWTLSGEAAAADRPLNSLLEKDLDFEHVGKPVPVITPEVSENIEELIKRRILAREFDEVIRRRPDVDSVPTGTRRGMVELDDSKPSKSLAEVYEEEHVKKTNPDGHVNKSDEKLQREEKEIEAMWKDVCGRLDALSSWHYKPKPTAPSLSVVADVATISMEDAQPATAQGVAGESTRLAPQEVYRAGAEPVARGEVVTRGGMPLARGEMSREDRTRRRRRHKERVRKAGHADAASARASTKHQTVAALKKGGVKVINRKGEVTDMEGKKPRAPKSLSSANLKL